VKNEKPKILILMGSGSDLPVMREAAALLSSLEVPYSAVVASAHRTPKRTRELVSQAEADGVQVFIAAAGAAAHLAGSVAAFTTRPVIGVPLDATGMGGMDALLSTVQMPGGIPVGTMAVGKAGARNAALFGAAILALADPELADRLKALRKAGQSKVLDGNHQVQESLAELDCIPYPPVP